MVAIALKLLALETLEYGSGPTASIYLHASTHIHTHDCAPERTELGVFFKLFNFSLHGQGRGGFNAGGGGGSWVQYAGSFEGTCVQCLV